MLNKKHITILLLLFISSCGSGSGSSSEPEKIDSEYQFELSAKLINQCRQEVTFDQFEVHLQDESWQLIEKYSPNANGLVSFTSKQKEINYTIVAKYQQGDSTEGLDIVSYFHAKTAAPSLYIATYDNLLDNGSCECITQNINVQHRVFSRIDTVSTSFPYEDWQQVDPQNTHFNNARICRIKDQEWPISSVSIRGLDAKNDTVGVASLLTGFSLYDDQLWEAAAVEVAETISLPQEHTAFELTQSFANGEHFSVNIGQDDELLPVFNSHPYVSESVYQSTSSHVFEDIDSIFGRSTFSSFHQIKSTIYAETFNVSAKVDRPNIDNTNYSELNSDGSYDYGAISDYPLIKFTFDYEVKLLNSDTITPVIWTMYGPIKGVLPSSVQLVGYDDVVTPKTKIFNTDIQIIKSSTSKNYEDYIRNYQHITDTDFYDDLNYFHLKVAF